MYAYSWSTRPDVRQQVAEIVGCRMVDGSCIAHQVQGLNPLRPGCPYVNSPLLREAKAGVA